MITVWKTKTSVERGYDPDLDFFPSETGTKEYYLFGIMLYHKHYKSLTDPDIIDVKDKKRNKPVGFK